MERSETQHQYSLFVICYLFTDYWETFHGTSLHWSLQWVERSETQHQYSLFVIRYSLFVICLLITGRRSMERLYIGHCNGWSEAKPNTILF
ncbi:hypothetical protein [Dactylococcopsis salina]|uniref:hypothetical protein n=1 Tax=Dactylococcopsis salina TaxID=292566 RepID=UPI0012EA9077|nr:hypothetical protein [Dactylococcopsis salina]